MNTCAEVCIIGGGAAGMMAALSAAKVLKAPGREGDVVLLERNRVLGRKLAITGKGRANVTNARSIDEFVQAFGPSGKFLYPAFESFFAEDLATVLGRAGLSLKMERGGRVFPVTDKAADVVQAFGLLLAQAHVDIHYGVRVQDLQKAATGEWIICSEGFPAIRSKTVVVATGGKSYPGTGSTGDGYTLAERLGHHVTRLLPGLVSLHCSDTWLRDLEGTSLEGIAVEAWAQGKMLGQRYGELMVTDRGIGGPTILSLSLAVAPALADGSRVQLKIDLRPGRTLEEILRDVEKCRSASDVAAYLQRFVPRKMAAALLQLWGLEDGGNHLLARKTSVFLAEEIKNLKLTCTGTGSLTSAIVTHGGISLQEINPRSLQSRIAPGVFIAGELLDVQAITGGYNLQAAFSTGFLAGKCAAEYIAKSANKSKL